MATGRDFVAACMRYEGTPYVLGGEHDLDEGFTPAAALDCSELVTAALADIGLSFPDGTWAQLDAVFALSVEAAIDTPGALLFTSGLPDHVAVSRGDGTTIEARGKTYGTGVFTAYGRFVSGGLIPGLNYSTPPEPVALEESSMFIHRPNLRSLPTGEPVLYNSQQVWDFNYLPNDGQVLGKWFCSSVLTLRALYGVAKDVLVFCDGKPLGPLALPADGRSVTQPVTQPGLVSVVGSDIAVEARELWLTQ